MTTITFYKADGFYYGFEEQGHTGYGESGEDILCSALSSMTMLIINAIEVTYNCNVDYTIDDTYIHKRAPSYTVGGNVNWCSHHGK